jgi:flagellar basal body-associated protein FliL
LPVENKTPNMTNKHQILIRLPLPNLKQLNIILTLNDLEDLTCDFYTRGYDRKVWPSDNIPLKDSQLLDHIQSQNSQIRNLLHSACLG